MRRRPGEGVGLASAVTVLETIAALAGDNPDAMITLLRTSARTWTTPSGGYRHGRRPTPSKATTLAGCCTPSPTTERRPAS